VDLPATRQMTIAEAEKSLWSALSDSRLIAEGLDVNGKPVQIPEREWPYLKLFEEGKRDALKYDVLDRQQPYAQVKLRRDDLLRLWPASLTPSLPAQTEIDATMLAPLNELGSAGYVPLCAALHWIATEGGSRKVMLEDEQAWQAGVEKLWPLITSDEIELNGLPLDGGMTERIPGSALNRINVLHPLHTDLGDILLSAPSHIVCSPYIDREHWSKGFNDQLFVQWGKAPAWSHLQVKRADIFARWPRPSPKTSAEQKCFRWLRELMRQSPARRTKPRAALLAEAQRDFGVGRNQFNRAWDRAVADSGATNWSNPGRTRKSNHSTN
jgi:hypothetical protein